MGNSWDRFFSQSVEGNYSSADVRFKITTLSLELTLKFRDQSKLDLFFVPQMFLIHIFIKTILLFSNLNNYLLFENLFISAVTMDQLLGWINAYTLVLIDHKE